MNLKEFTGLPILSYIKLGRTVHNCEPVEQFFVCFDPRKNLYDMWMCPYLKDYYESSDAGLLMVPIRELPKDDDVSIVRTDFLKHWLVSFKGVKICDFDKDKNMRDIKDCSPDVMRRVIDVIEEYDFPVAFKSGDIVRYGGGPTAIAKLISPHCGGWHANHCLGGGLFVSENKISLATDDDIKRAQQSTGYCL